MLPHKFYKGAPNEDATKKHRGLLTAAAYTKLSNLLGINSLDAAHFSLVSNMLGVITPWAVDDLRMGTHPAHGAYFPGVWNAASAAAGNYALLAHPYSTYLNAPSGGNIFFGINNVYLAQISASGFFLNGGAIYGPGAEGASYGHLTIRGTLGAGWGGIQFKDAGGTNLGTLMIGSNILGMYNAANTAWNWYWSGGTLIAGTVPYANLSGVGNAATYNVSTVPAANAVQAMNASGQHGGIISQSAGTSGSCNNIFIDDIISYRTINSATGVIFLNSSASRYLYNDGTQYILAGQSLVVNGTTYTSSAEYKTNIAVMKDGALEKLKKFVPKLFEYKETPGQQRVGFIYEDVISHAPEMLTQSTGANGETIKSMDYTSVFVLNVKATQELAAQVEALTNRVATLETRLAALERGDRPTP